MRVNCHPTSHRANSQTFARLLSSRRRVELFDAEYTSPLIQAKFDVNPRHPRRTTAGETVRLTSRDFTRVCTDKRANPCDPCVLCMCVCVYILDVEDRCNSCAPTGIARCYRVIFACYLLFLGKLAHLRPRNCSIFEGVAFACRFDSFKVDSIWRRCVKTGEGRFIV